MIAVRIIGWLVLLAAAVVLAHDMRVWMATGLLDPIKLYQVWLDLNRGSLERLVSVLTPWLWEMLRNVLSLWALPAFAVPGLLLVWIGRKTHVRRI